MLPAKPKIFHGRDPEVKHVVKALIQEPARIAILGAGGMGKTSLARAVLHDAQVAAKFPDRLFVSCDSATTSIEVAALIGSYVGLKPGPDLTQPVIRYFSTNSPCLLVLDNLETPWEPLESRAGIEELLSLLTDVPHLSLIVSGRP
jgi:predicted ATPase